MCLAKRRSELSMPMAFVLGFHVVWRTPPQIVRDLAGVEEAERLRELGGVLLGQVSSDAGVRNASPERGVGGLELYGQGRQVAQRERSLALLVGRLQLLDVREDVRVELELPAEGGELGEDRVAGLARDAGLPGETGRRARGRRGEGRCGGHRDQNRDDRYEERDDESLDPHRDPPVRSGAALCRRRRSKRCERGDAVGEVLTSTLMMASMLGRAPGRAPWNEPSIFMERPF